MNAAYLRAQGFAPLHDAHPTFANFARAWSYRHTVATQDGTLLYAEHPLGIDSCRLSHVAAPLSTHDVFATVGLHDRPAFEAAVAAFYAAHGGPGRLAPRPQVPNESFRPQRRQP